MRWTLLALPLLLAGCAHDGPARTPITPAPDDVVLRTVTVGGVAGLGGKGTLPDVSIYGDGRVIAGDASWANEYRLTPAAYARLISQARKAGLGRPRTIDDSHVADAFYSVVSFAEDRPAATSKIIKMPGQGGAAAAFVARLNPRTWPAGDLRAGPRPYAPANVAVLAAPPPSAEPGRPWPFGRLGGGTPVAAVTCTVLTGGDATRARRLADTSDLWTDHGRTYAVTFRPLLPDEPDCAALAR
jgi:hypothetical protein